MNEHLNVLVTPHRRGHDVSRLACARAHKACRQGCSALYLRLPLLLQELHTGRADGRYAKLMRQIAKIEVLVLDDWGIAPLTDTQRRDVLELVDDRYNQRSTIVTSQLPIAHWHEAVGDPRSLMRSSIASCTTPTRSICPDHRCANRRNN